MGITLAVATDHPEDDHAQLLDCSASASPTPTHTQPDPIPIVLLMPRLRAAVFVGLVRMRSAMTPKDVLLPEEKIQELQVPRFL